MSFVKVEQKEGYAVLTIDREKALNALNSEVLGDLEAAVDALAAAGIIDSPERWKALDYTANTVRLLLLKMGRYVTQ